MSWFVSGEQINYLPKFYLMNICGKRSDLPFFSRKNDRKKEKTWFRLRMSRILFAAELLSQTQSQNQLDDIADEQTIICRGLN